MNYCVEALNKDLKTLKKKWGGERGKKHAFPIARGSNYTSDPRCLAL